MNIPEFRNDSEMAEWAEANNLDAADLEDADEVTISSDVSVVVIGWLYSPVGALEGTTANSSPSATDQERELELVPT
jgi:hypothetical protein